jgi:micrococcal nuclease
VTKPRPFRRPYRAIALALAIGAAVAGRYWVSPPETGEPGLIAEGEYTVLRVVDGDTLLVAPKDAPRNRRSELRVRLLGVNAPETVRPDHPIEPWGPEASAFASAMVGKTNDKARLQFDKERLDRYGRILAYVWLGDKMLNEELIRAGVARADLKFRYAQPMKRRFRAAQDEARAARRGIWSEK